MFDPRSGRQKGDSRVFAIGAIAKDEPEHYVREWLDWHRSVGVDRFFIYDNGGWTVRDRDIMVYNVPGKVIQTYAYNHCLHNCDNADYLAIIDLDEFIMGPVLRRLHSVENSLSLNWKLFGTSGLVENPEKRQMGVFKNHLPADHGVSSHVKSIVRPSRTLGFDSPHYGVHVDGGMQEDYNGRRFLGAFNPITEFQGAWINHYWTREMNAWKKKVARGRFWDNNSLDVNEAEAKDRECTMLEQYSIDL